MPLDYSSTCILNSTASDERGGLALFLLHRQCSASEVVHCRHALIVGGAVVSCHHAILYGQGAAGVKDIKVAINRQRVSVQVQHNNLAWGMDSVLVSSMLAATFATFPGELVSPLSTASAAEGNRDIIMQNTSNVTDNRILINTNSFFLECVWMGNQINQLNTQPLALAFYHLCNVFFKFYLCNFWSEIWKRRLNNVQSPFAICGLGSTLMI